MLILKLISGVRLCLLACRFLVLEIHDLWAISLFENASHIFSLCSSSLFGHFVVLTDALGCVSFT